jgi:mannosyltransferase OCH1-like enzyme
MIPRVVHQIWFKRSPNPPPLVFMREWKRMCDVQDWQYILHEDDTGLEAYPTWTRKADVRRLQVVATTGGIYLDADLEPLRTLGEELFEGEWLVYENEKESMLIGNHAMGLMKSSRFAFDCLEKIYAGRDGIDAAATGPGLLTEVYREETTRLPRVLPSFYFAPEYANGEPAPEGPEDPYARHYWATTRRQYGTLVPPEARTLDRHKRLVHDLYLEGLRKVSGNVVR